MVEGGRKKFYTDGRSLKWSRNVCIGVKVGSFIGLWNGHRSLMIARGFRFFLVFLVWGFGIFLVFWALTASSGRFKASKRFC